jgi:hypothetical protein
VLLTQEEYSSGEEEEEEEETTSEVATIVTTSIPSTSLFESPNENLSNNKDAKCFMAKTSEVSPSSKSILKSKNAMMDDLKSLKVKEEVVALDVFISNLQGEAKKHFESLMGQLGKAQDLIELKERFERENVDEIGSLSQALEEEQDLRVTLEESISSLEVSHNVNVSKLTKERDHALAMSNMLKKEKVEFGVGHAKLIKDLETLDKAHKALESDFSNLSKSHEQLKI